MVVVTRVVEKLEALVDTALVGVTVVRGMETVTVFIARLCVVLTSVPVWDVVAVLVVKVEFCCVVRVLLVVCGAVVEKLEALVVKMFWPVAEVI